jgi:hypothetical protein
VENLAAIAPTSPGRIQGSPAALRLPGKISALTVRGFATVLGTFYLYGLARVYNILRQIGMIKA